VDTPAAAAPGRVARFRDPLVPQFEFEWHPGTGKVYVLEAAGRHEAGAFVPDPSARARRAVVVAEHCDHHARAYGFVQTFLRGYKKAAQDAPKLAGSALAAGAAGIAHNTLYRGDTDG
jgi:hypothetical protein